MTEPVYYTPPESHEGHIRRMVVWLTLFFATLLVVATLLIIFADTIARKLPFSAEKRFIRPYEAMAQYFFDEEPSKHKLVVEEYLNNLATKLIIHMDLPKDYLVDVHYIDNGTVNAFATLGGHVFVFRGLLEAMPDENSLSMVLAHEIAHVKHRDPLAAMSRGFALQMMYSFAVGDYAAGAEVALDGSEIGLMYFGREQEQAADLEAIKAIKKHYGHVGGHDFLFRYILEEMGEEETKDGEIDWAEWLSTHPKLERRIEFLGQYAKENNLKLRGQSTHISENIFASIKEIKKESRRAKKVKNK